LFVECIAKKRRFAIDEPTSERSIEKAHDLTKAKNVTGTGRGRCP